jgi:hypothetical protein
MPGVPLSLVHPAARYTGLAFIAPSDPSVKSRLGFAHPLRPSLGLALGLSMFAGFFLALIRSS